MKNNIKFMSIVIFSSSLMGSDGSRNFTPLIPITIEQKETKCKKTCKCLLPWFRMGLFSGIASGITGSLSFIDQTWGPRVATLAALSAAGASTTIVDSFRTFPPALTIPVGTFLTVASAAADWALGNSESVYTGAWVYTGYATLMLALEATKPNNNNSIWLKWGRKVSDKLNRNCCKPCKKELTLNDQIQRELEDHGDNPVEYLKTIRLRLNEALIKTDELESELARIKQYGSIRNRSLLREESQTNE